MTIDFICEELAELFDSPCNYSPIDEKMFQDSYCESHCGKVTDKECWKQYFEKVWADRKTESSSEIPNNCEHITEDGVTCAKYPACDDCLDNPLNKVKGSERLVKGSEQTDCQTCKWGEWYRQGYDITMMDDECGGCCSWNSKWTPKTEPTISKMEQVDKDINVRSKTEPQTEEWHDDCNTCRWHDGACTIPCCDYEPKTEPQTDCSWK